MQELIKSNIKYLARKKLKVRRDNLQIAEKYRKKYELRTHLPSGLPDDEGGYEAVHRHFDPIYCLRNANFLSKTIWLKCLNLDYQPIPSLLRQVPKDDGGYRPIMEFSIPDSALSKAIHSKVAPRNLKNQSANSYAYRQDRNIFDALLKLKNSIDKSKVFIAQYDFEQYFDKIPRKHLNSLINNREFFIATEVERHVIQSFLDHTYAERDDYIMGQYIMREEGTPQGSSISLLLANLANAPLDKELERLNGQFIRFADDVVNVAYNYEDALKIESAFYAHCDKSGIKINVKKSKGVFVLSPKDQELRSQTHFRFLGYKISKQHLSISDKAKNKLKRKISRLINLYLHRHPREGQFNINRSGRGYDYDLVGCIYEIRNIIYGGVTEQDIESFLKTGKKLPKMKGYMGFYCLMDKVDDLKEIDGWLASTLYQAVRKRAYYLEAMGHLYTPPTFDQIVSGSWCTVHHNFAPVTKLPSLVRGWRAARKFYYTYGLEEVEAPNYSSA